MSGARGKRGPGRPPGSPNKTTASVKEALTIVFQERGGTRALLAWAAENQTEFYKLWGRMLPQEHSGPGGGPMEFAGLIREITRANKNTDR